MEYNKLFTFPEPGLEEEKSMHRNRIDRLGLYLRSLESAMRLNKDRVLDNVNVEVLKEVAEASDEDLMELSMQASLPRESENGGKFGLNKQNFKTKFEYYVELRSMALGMLGEKPSRRKTN